MSYSTIISESWDAISPGPAIYVSVLKYASWQMFLVLTLGTRSNSFKSSVFPSLDLNEPSLLKTVFLFLVFYKKRLHCLLILVLSASFKRIGFINSLKSLIDGSKIWILYLPNSFSASIKDYFPSFLPIL